MTFDPLAATSQNLPERPATPVVPPQLVGQNTYVTNFDDESVRKYDFDLYAGRKDQTDRIYLVRPERLVKARQHYHDKLKYVRCNSKYETQGNQEILTAEAACCKKLGKSNIRFGALVLKYNTDRVGNLTKPFGFELRLWKFGVDKYIVLKTINKDFPLANHDLTLSCSDEQYQKLTIGAKPDCVFTLPGFPADLKGQIEAWAASAMAKLPDEMGRIMSDADILKELGQATGVAPTMTAGDAPITNFDEIVGAAQK